MRCFSSPGLLSSKGVTELALGRVAPFGNPGIKACVPLPLAYRSLPRPSSPPCAQAFPTCLHSLDYQSRQADYARSSTSETKISARLGFPEGRPGQTAKLNHQC